MSWPGEGGCFGRDRDEALLKALLATGFRIPRKGVLLSLGPVGDKYRFTEGRVFMSGVQALVRLPLVQQARDKAEGFNTGGFISGYRGSPHGTYDQELCRPKKMPAGRNIIFVPERNGEPGPPPSRCRA